MILSIVLLHAVAAHFGFRLKYKALALCALSSIGISLVALRTSAFVDKIFFVKLAAMIVVAALLSTVINSINRAKPKPAVVDQALDIEIKDEPAPAPVEHIRRPQSREVDVVKRRVAELKAQKLSERPAFDAAQAQSIVQSIVDNQKKSPADKKVDDKKTSPLERKPSAIEQKISVSSEPTVKPKRTTVVERKAAHLAAANEKISAAIDKSKPDKKSADDDKPEPIKKKSAIEFGITEEDLSAVEEHLHSLDDILEFAYAAKQSGNFKLAIYSYQKALERYREDDYAPFIVVDLSSLYKEQAAYIKAIKVCEDALRLPAVVRNDAARKECRENLAYLRVVQSVLLKHRALSTPFSKISRPLRAEIDAEFKKQSVFSAV